MTKAATRAKYFANEGWPKPVPKLPNKVVVRPTDDGAGMGVFATRDIKRFEPVLVERPYLVYSKASSIELSPKAFEELSEDQIVQIKLNQVERYYQIVVDQQMIGEAREGFMSLANSHKNDGSGPVFGIVRTNAWEISFGEVISGVDEDFGKGYGAIARVGSRFNHR
jgi:NOL1/NOP2/fmu family ribosome biogenesis protein